MSTLTHAHHHNPPPPLPTYTLTHFTLPYPSQNTLEGDATITMDHSLHHHQQLQEANRGLDHILNHGRDIVTNLKGQGLTLKASISSTVFDYKY